ncbi:MAG: glycerol-3-phosphate dehydrogenase/oxidase [Microbacteriaceae bacterium]
MNSPTPSAASSPSPSSTLSPEQRILDLEAMAAEPVDVLVIGGGVVGAGAALDAASRGLSVAIVEARDWASGTSSRSSKLVHGGLRYLEMLDFRLVFEALRERGILMKTVAPHLVRPITFMYPLTHRVWERFYVGAGIMLYDFLALLGGKRDKGLSWNKHFSRTGARKALPGLNQQALIGAIRYSDAQVDDARLTMTIIKTARVHGAKTANWTEATELLRDGDRVLGAVIRDQESGKSYTVTAQQTIIAGGVWTENIQNLGDVPAEMLVHASKGIHIIVDKAKLSGESGILLRTEQSVLFVIPWGNQWIIGTTDTPWKLQKEHPSANRQDIDYLLNHVNTILEQPLTHDDVVGVYAGLRPLVSAKEERTTRISREHHVEHPLENLSVIAGGKLTTYRVMAKDVVDAAMKNTAQVPKSQTDTLPLIGAVELGGIQEKFAKLAAQYQIDESQYPRLINRYGSLVTEIFAMIEQNSALAGTLPSSQNYLYAEALYAVTHEGALHLEDVLTRRTRISVETADRGVDSAEAVAALIAPALGWDAETTQREVQRYRDRVKYERLAAVEQSDELSEQVRLLAGEVHTAA